MTVSTVLPEFVRDALGRGIARPQVKEALTRAGWEDDQIKAALGGFAEVDFPVPVPRPAPYVSARDVFMYFVLFGTLYMSAFNLGNLLFDFINLAVPDPAVRSGVGVYINHESMRWSTSTLIVTFPLFLYVSRIVNRTVREDARKRGSVVRHNMTYMTLFIAGICLLGDVIVLVYNFLGGDLTTRFVLKVLTIGAIAGPVFWYYLRDLRLDDQHTGGRP